MKQKRARKFRLFSDRRAVSPVIANVIMAGAIVVIGFSVLSWTFSQSAEFSNRYSSSMQANLNKLKEKLVCEYISYNGSSGEVNVFLLNCGESVDVSLVSATLRNSTWHQAVSSPELKLLNNTQVQSLSVDEEGRFKMASVLQAGTSYTLSISTSRGKSFVAKFVA